MECCVFFCQGCLHYWLPGPNNAQPLLRHAAADVGCSAHGIFSKALAVTKSPASCLISCLAVGASVARGATFHFYSGTLGDEVQFDDSIREERATSAANISCSQLSEPFIYLGCTNQDRITSSTACVVPTLCKLLLEATLQAAGLGNADGKWPSVRYVTLEPGCLYQNAQAIVFVCMPLDDQIIVRSQEDAVNSSGSNAHTFTSSVFCSFVREQKICAVVG